MTIEIRGIRFDSAGEALQWINASGRGRAISVGGAYLVVEPAEADRLASKGVEFAFLVEHYMPDGNGRIMTVPVND